MNRKYIYLLALALLSGSAANAQYIIKEANKQFSLYNYSKSSKLYAEAYKKRKKASSAELAGESYRRMFDYQNAERWYGIAVADTSAGTRARFGYARMLQANGKFDEARAQYEKIKDPSVNPSLLAVLKASCDSARVWMAHPQPLKIENMAVWNSPSSDWAPAGYQDETVFTSDRPNTAIGTGAQQGKPFLRFDGRTIMPADQKYLWTGKDYNHLYIVAPAGDKQAEGAGITGFPIDAGTKYHVASPNFSLDGSELFFTLTRISREIMRVDSIPTANTELYSSKKDASGNWLKPEPMPFNKAGFYSVGDPFIKGDTLYFSSNMPGGKGQADLYYTVRDASGNWGPPKNIAWANTAGNDRSPSLDKTGNFFFASDGRVGIGGLDMFRAKGNGDAGDSIQNLGYPANSARDDFAMLVRDQKGIVYFSSNREGGHGGDDIYGLEMQLVPPAIVRMLAGTAYDKLSGRPLEGVQVTLQGLEGKMQTVTTDASGRYEFRVNATSSYVLKGTKLSYIPATESLRTDTAIKYTRDLKLSPVIGNKPIVLKDIYYDFDKSNIRPDAAKELDRLMAILRENPDLNLELSSHTDSRGPDAYNQQLSQRRAESAVAYLVQHGIAKGRIIARGYGETGLVNRCSNGVNCSVPEHQANRRTEIRKTN